MIASYFIKTVTINYNISDCFGTSLIQLRPSISSMAPPVGGVMLPVGGALLQVGGFLLPVGGAILLIDGVVSRVVWVEDLPVHCPHSRVQYPPCLEIRIRMGTG